jgi:integrase/recombinase XerD
VLPVFAFWRAFFMRKMRMSFPKEKTFADAFEEYILDCKARNLREGTIHHYRESVKQIYKRIPPNTPISTMDKRTMTDFYIALREDPNLNEVSMGTYARDLKTLMRFFMKCNYIPHVSFNFLCFRDIYGIIQYLKRKEESVCVKNRDCYCGCLLSL